jgi:hypothetical protein
MGSRVFWTLITSSKESWKRKDSPKGADLSAPVRHSNINPHFRSTDFVSFCTNVVTRIGNINTVYYGFIAPENVKTKKTSYDP